MSFTHQVYLVATALKWVTGLPEPKTLSKHGAAALLLSAPLMLRFHIQNYEAHTVAHERLDCLAFALCGFIVAGLGLSCSWARSFLQVHSGLAH